MLTKNGAATMKQLIATVSIIAMSAQALAHTTGSAHVHTEFPMAAALGAALVCGMLAFGLRK